tara:strand:- start:238 stop:411 length:174 start_codon:yes stop_codon:yes gene_type:complete
MNQNYINIFHNSGDGVTVQYGNKVDEQTIDIDMISFRIEDLVIIAEELIKLASEVEG